MFVWQVASADTAATLVDSPAGVQQLKLVGNTGKRPFPVVRHIYDVYENSDEIGGRDFFILVLSSERDRRSLF